MSQTSETVLEINLSALEHNYKYLRSQIAPTTKMLGVVKAFAYGSDAVAIAKRLEKLGINYFAVAYTQEGVSLRKGGIEKPILVLHPQSTNFEEVIEHNLFPNIYSKYTLGAFIKTAEKLQLKKYPIHLKINTGLNRLGFDPEEANWITDRIAQTESVKIEGIFSHLAASEDKAERDFTKYQIENYKSALDQILPKLDYKPIRHLCNTSGILNYPEAHYDMVRTGIGLYGFGNSAEEDQKLQPVATLKTIISQIHHIKKGESVGYNRGFKAEKDTKTATLPLGHADGINRIYGKQKTKVLINGQLASIIGNVCMDMLMIDISEIDCEEGDEVILFGKEKSAEEFAHNAGTISYELITSISQRVKRKIIN
ncbi:alanine racemase [Mesonia aestuariivivens]|uniref:Alanine racemase n=1 Tax=Mesonia aestuariivivens TaxID=2796128 RepID=A0ABS6W184_9FLAO|nr:alanine racemase [Mesonia aestuariivivens]MBW2961617.1 alanine racemase [Mesonia aestuariivivens]